MTAPARSELQQRLPRTYDVGRLDSDWSAVSHFRMRSQPGPYHDGEWRGISLYAQGGAEEAGAGGAALRPHGPTPALACAPYFQEILDELRCPKMSVRLLVLPPGGQIREHYDIRVNFMCGMLRLHVPIVTHEDVEFVIGGESCSWRAGELWYGDFSKPHHVSNRSPLSRVHMVIDVEINDFVLDLFPAPFIRSKREDGSGIAMARDPYAQAESPLESFVCSFTLPREVMPLFGGGRKLTSFPRQTLVHLHPTEGTLVATIDAEPWFALTRVAETVFNIVGLSAGCSMRFLMEAEVVRGITLQLTGLPMDLYAAQLGFGSPELCNSRQIVLPLANGSGMSRERRHGA